MELIKKLIGVLYDNSVNDKLYNLMDKLFNYNVKAANYDGLKDVSTGYGIIDDNRIKEIIAKYKQDGNSDLIRFWEKCIIREYDEAEAVKFFNDSIEKFNSGDYSFEDLMLLVLMYPEKNEEIASYLASAAENNTAQSEELVNFIVRYLPENIEEQRLIDIIMKVIDKISADDISFLEKNYRAERSTDSLMVFLSNYILDYMPEGDSVQCEELLSGLINDAVEKVYIKAENTDIITNAANKLIAANQSIELLRPLHKMYNFLGDERGKIAFVLLNLAENNESVLIEYSIADLFYRVVQHGTPEEIIEFCKQWSTAASLIENEKGAGAEELHKTDDDNVLFLIQHYKDPKAWEICRQLPVCNEETNNAKILYIRTELRRGNWKEYIDYCFDNDLYDYGLQGINKYLETLQDFDNRIIDIQRQIRGLIEDGIFNGYIPAAVPILDKMIRHYGVAGNHTVSMKYEELRTIMTIAECFSIEEELLKWQVIMDTITEERPEAGIALAGTLLLKNSDKAAKIIEDIGELQKLRNIPDKFYKAINDIIKMPEEERMAEIQKKDFVSFIRIMQPLGEYPSYTDLRKYLFANIENENIITAARTIYRLLMINDNDGAISICLYIASKYIDERYKKEKCLYIQNSLYLWLRHPCMKFKETIKCIYMITAANKYIQKEFPELINSEYNIDNSMSKSAMQLYGEFADNIDAFERLDIEDINEQIRALTDSREPVDIDIVEAIMTGDWSKALVRMYNQSMSLEPITELISITEAGILESIAVSYNVMQRSNAGNKFLKWLKNEISDYTSLYYVTMFVNALIDNAKYRHHLNYILQIPFDEAHVVFPECINLILSKTNIPLDDCCNALTVAAYIAHNANMRIEDTWVYTYINKNARDALDRRDYDTALMLFGTLENLNYSFGIHINAEYRSFVYTELEIELELEKRRSFKTAAGLLGRDEATVKKAGKGFKPHTCVNICVACLSSAAANEYKLLTNKMTNKNKKLAETVYDLICGSASNAEKLSLADTFAQADAKPSLYFIVNRVTGGKTTEEGQEAWNKYMTSNTVYGAEAYKFPHLYMKPHHNAYSLIEYDFSEEDAEDENELIELPEYVGRLDMELKEYFSEARSVNEIEEEYRSIPFSDVQQRRTKAYRVYRSSVNNNLSQQYSRCVALGIEEYKYLKLSSDGKTDKAVVGLFYEIIEFAIAAKVTDESFKLFATNTIMDIIIGCSDIYELSEIYTQFKNSMLETEKCLASEADVTSYKVVLSNIETVSSIVDRYRDYEDDQELCSELIRFNSDNSNSGKLSPMWRDTYHRIKNIVANNISKLRFRPILECYVLSKEGRPDGAVFGQIKNTGTMTAFDVEIKIFYNNGSVSNYYKVDRIKPDAKAPFEIKYDMDSNEEQISFSVHGTYTNQDGKEYTLSLEGCTMDIVRRDDVNIPSGYDIETLKFNDPSDMRRMYGRRREKRFLEDVVRGEFKDYKNLFVRGMKRSGKSTLLYYLRYYIEKNCENVIPLYIDLEGVSGSAYSGFIKKIKQSLDEYENNNKLKFVESGIDMEEVHELFASVQEEEFRVDMLALFYMQLVEKLNGYRLVLIFDEFDVVLSYYKDKDNSDMNLLRALRELVNKVELREYVHFVFCGSDNLYKFEMDVSDFHQFFQSLNSLEVGNMSKEDMRDMLENSFNSEDGSPMYDLVYTDDAIDWIYYYTRGMVWHTKLLANLILEKRLSAQRRCVVYPSDVCECIQGMLSNGSCNQLFLSCNEDEKLVIRAMQYLITEPYGKVSFDRLVKAIGERLTLDELKNAINFLSKLGLIKNENGVYSFPNELYRRYFILDASKLPDLQFYDEVTEDEGSEFFEEVRNVQAGWLTLQ